MSSTISVTDAWPAVEPARVSVMTPQTIGIQDDGIAPAQDCCQGYTQSFVEFVTILRNPFHYYNGTMCMLLRVHQHDPVLALGTWCGINFLYGLLTTLTNVIFMCIGIADIAAGYAAIPLLLPGSCYAQLDRFILVSSLQLTKVSASIGGNIFVVILFLVLGVAWSYFWSHLVWFCSIKVNGCGCGSCCYLLLAVVNLMGAFFFLLYSLLSLIQGSWLAIPATLLYTGCIMIALYMGKNLFDISQTRENHATTVEGRAPIAVGVPVAGCCSV